MINNDIYEFIEENDVKFIRLGFCEPFGNQKNISIMASEIEEAFENGIPFDSSTINAFSDDNNSDLLLFPDMNTLSLLPWRPNMNSVLRFYCDIKKSDKTSFKSDGRFILKNAIENMKSLGFNCQIGTECEFYLFKTTETDDPTLSTLDNGGYLDISPIDKGENIRREICLCLEEMGLNPKSSYHEKGPGQNQINFKASDVLTSADHFLTFKSVVKSIVARNGLFASFMPKPFLDKIGNGMHINMLIYKDGVNIFSDKNSENFKYAKYFIAGVLEKIPEITLFLNPNNNSYERLEQFEPTKLESSPLKNYSHLIKVPVVSKGNERMELRSPDATLNPYLAFSLILYAGMYGIENKLSLPKSFDENVESLNGIVDSLDSLPKNLKEAIDLAEKSEFVRKHLNKEFLDKYIKIKRKEYDEFENASNKALYYQNTYFEQL